MTVIYKYPIALCGKFTLNLPFGAVIIDIQLQDGYPYLWAIVEPAHAPEERILICAWTGFEFNYAYGLLHIKTLTDIDGLVWHIFEDAR